MDQITQDTATRAETRLWKPSKTKLVAHVNVSVSQYDNGALVASHARMDRNSGRYVFTKLSQPSYDGDCPHYLAWCLAEAAQEVLGDLHAEQPHI